MFNWPAPRSTTAACSQSPHGVTARNLLSELQVIACRSLSSTSLGESNLVLTTLGRSVESTSRYERKLSSFFLRANCTPSAMFFSFGENESAQMKGAWSPSKGAPAISAVSLMSDCCFSPITSAASAGTAESKNMQLTLRLTFWIVLILLQHQLCRAQHECHGGIVWPLCAFPRVCQLAVGDWRKKIQSGWSQALCTSVRTNPARVSHSLLIRGKEQ